MFVTDTLFASEWHSEKNAGLDPATVRAGSHKKVWWVCSVGHEFEAIISNRSRGSGCPYCSGQKVLPGYNDLATLQPVLAKEWGSSNQTKPDQVLAGGKTRYFWVCQNTNAHEYAMTVLERLRGRDCPYCSGKAILVGYNDVASTHPELVTEWSQQNTLKPTEVSAGSKKVIEWIAPTCGHVWKASVQSRFTTGKKLLLGCPYCAGRKFKSGVNDLRTTHPEHVAYWHPTANSVSPEDISSTYSKGIAWLCDRNHTFKLHLETKLKKEPSYCPKCSNPKLTQGVNDLASQAPNLLGQWDYKKNTDSPEKVTVKSGKNVWWLCENNHSWVTSPYRRSLGHGCPICTGRYTVPGVNDLETVNPRLLEGWSSLNTIQPSELSPRSLIPVWWDCSAGHSWKASPYNRSALGSGCPYCAGQRAITGVNDIATVNPELIKEWDYDKNTVTPEEVMAGSGQRIWWLCEQGHSWEAVVASRNAGRGCLQCFQNEGASKAEKEIADYCAGLAPLLRRNVRDVLASGREIDIYIPDLAVGFEYNGMYWHSLEAGTSKEYHLEKYLEAQASGVHLVFIWEDEWNSAENQKSLKQEIQAILSDKGEALLRQKLMLEEFPLELIVERGSIFDYLLATSGDGYGYTSGGNLSPESKGFKGYTVWNAGYNRYLRGEEA